MSLFNLESQLNAYAPYHQNKWNILIHIICVPIIFWTVLVWLSVYGTVTFADVSFGLLSHPFPVNFAFIATTVYALFYILLEPVAGITVSIILYALCYTANIYAATPYAAFNAVIIHVVCWILQFIGHGVAEGRAPALFDSFVQALLLAPIFVWLEILFKLGYRPQLHKQIVENAQKDIDAWKKRKSSGQVGKTKTTTKVRKAD
jgi:uncharacterized membrane protein YGL010W